MYRRQYFLFKQPMLESETNIDIGTSNGGRSEGGWEGGEAQIVYNQPGSWKADFEKKIIHKVLQLAKETGIELPESNFFPK